MTGEIEVDLRMDFLPVCLSFGMISPLYLILLLPEGCFSCASLPADVADLPCLGTVRRDHRFLWRTRHMAMMWPKVKNSFHKAYF